jgi:hypothetical protein
MTLSLVVVIMSAILMVKEKGKGEQLAGIDEDSNRAHLTCIRSALAVVSIMSVVAAAAYIGASITPETTFSDIRTIAFVLPSLMLPFLFTWKPLLALISSRRFLLVLMIILIVMASLRTGYEVYPKSVYDPINVVEDPRLGTDSIYDVGDFIVAHYGSGSITADYKVLNRIQYLIASPQYNRQLLGPRKLTEGYDRGYGRGILVFDIAGIEYPSPFHSTQLYLAAYNFSMTHNRICDNGDVVVTQ